MAGVTEDAVVSTAALLTASLTTTMFAVRQ